MPMPGSLTDQLGGYWSPIPDWIAALAEECERTSQNRTAERIGYSPTVVSTILKAKYTGNLQAVEAAVRDSLMRDQVDCPVLGLIGGSDCRGHQRAGFSAANPLRLQLYRACRTCPHRSSQTNPGGKDVST